MGFWDEVKNLGEEAAREAAKRGTERLAERAVPGANHIPEQNRTVAELGRVLDAYHAGSITKDQAAADIEGLTREFEEYCRVVGSTRAAQGARDVRALSETIKRDLGGVTPLPIPGTPDAAGKTPPYSYTSGKSPWVTASVSPLIWVGLGGVFLFSKMGKRR